MISLRSHRHKRADYDVRGSLGLEWFKGCPRDRNFPEASQEHLLGTLFHHILQKVRGYVDEFTSLMRESTT
jgi:hypothetical protein